MKFILFVTLLMASLSSFAQISNRADPDYCRGQDACKVGGNLFGNGGVIHASGDGRNCSQAQQEAQRNFHSEFPGQSCGTFGLQFQSCYGGRGSVKAWYQCYPQRSQAPGRGRSRCANVGGVIGC